MVKMAKLALLVLVSFLLAIPTVHALGIAPAEYPDEVFQPDTLVSYDFWATNFNSDEELNCSVEKEGDLIEYVILPFNHLTIPADSQVKFTVQIDYPEYIEAGEYLIKIILTEDYDPDATGRVAVGTGIRVTAEEPDYCQIIDEAGTYDIYTDVVSENNTCIEITASDVVVDCHGHEIKGNSGDNSKGIYAHDVADVEINNCELVSWEKGIRFRNVSGGIVSNNDFHDNELGLILEFTEDLAVKDNAFHNNEVIDIGTAFSGNNIFTDIMLETTKVSFTYEGDLMIKGIEELETEPQGYDNIGKQLAIDFVGLDLGIESSIDLDISYDGANLYGRNEGQIQLGVTNGEGNWRVAPGPNFDYSINPVEDYVSTDISNTIGIFSLIVREGQTNLDKAPGLVDLSANAVDYSDESKKVEGFIAKPKSETILDDSAPIKDTPVQNTQIQKPKQEKPVEDIVVLEVIDVEVIGDVVEIEDSPDNDLMSRFIFWLSALF